MKLRQNVGACSVCGHEEKPNSPNQLPTRTVLNGKYIVGKVLGEGGFGITYLGLEISTSKKVAIKEFFPMGFAAREKNLSVIPSSSDNIDFFNTVRAGFLDEANSLKTLTNLPGVVCFVDTFAQNNTLYLVMEFVDGTTLKDYLANMGGKLVPMQVFDMIKPVMESLNIVHRNGVIHRDISPDNIMITQDGRVKLLDFGSARVLTQKGKQKTPITLKKGYAPLEQYNENEKPGPWTDVYALCATIYRAMTGITPQAADERAKKDSLMPPSRLGVQVSAQQEAALMKGLALDKIHRFQNIAGLFIGLYDDMPAQKGSQIEVVSSVKTSKIKEAKPAKPKPQSKSKNVCSNCGTKNPGKNKFCANCGFEIPKEVSAVPEAPTAAKAAEQPTSAVSQTKALTEALNTIPKEEKPPVYVEPDINEFFEEEYVPDELKIRYPKELARQNAVNTLWDEHDWQERVIQVLFDHFLFAICIFSLLFLLIANINYFNVMFGLTCALFLYKAARNTVKIKLLTVQILVCLSIVFLTIDIPLLLQLINGRGYSQNMIIFIIVFSIVSVIVSLGAFLASNIETVGFANMQLKFEIFYAILIPILIGLNINLFLI